jgi:hypothetical protein
MYVNKAESIFSIFWQRIPSSDKLFSTSTTSASHFFYIFFYSLFNGFDHAFQAYQRQGCQIFLGLNLPKREKIPNESKLYQKAITYTKWQYNISMGN